MLEKTIPTERLKPKYPCPACGKLFDDCVCSEDESDKGFAQMISAGFIAFVGFILFAILMWFFFIGRI
jgi:hypothetical protein